MLIEKPETSDFNAFFEEELVYSYECPNCGEEYQEALSKHEIIDCLISDGWKKVTSDNYEGLCCPYCVDVFLNPRPPWQGALEI